MYDITIIVPAYNCGKYINDCIDSIVNQMENYKIEIIVINDCSVDDTLINLKKYVKYSFFKLINLDKNKGVSNARNLGIDKASGKYLFFLDGDDFLVPGSISKMINLINVNNYDIIKFSFINYYKKIPYKKYKFQRTGLLNVDNYYNDFIFQTFLHYFDFHSSCGQLILSNIAKSNKFNEDLIVGEDMTFNLNMYFKVKNIYVDNSPVFYYRVNTNSVMRSYNKTKIIPEAVSCYKAYSNLYLYDKLNLHTEEIGERILSVIISIFSDLYINDFRSFNSFYENFLEEINKLNLNKIKNIDNIEYIKKMCKIKKRKNVLRNCLKKIIINFI